MSVAAQPAPPLEPLGSVSNRNELAALLGISPRKLKYLLYRLTPRTRYRLFEIKKRSGGKRRIRAPIPPLKALQAKIADHLAVSYRPRSFVFGYVRGRNIQQNAERHLCKRWVFHVDLKDFFPSINFGRVRGLLLKPPFSLNSEVATTLAQICCFENEIPQGSPASPVISNMVCRGLDNALGSLAREHRCSYSRYCDDLVFSTNRTKFPPALGLVGPSGHTIVGPALLGAINQAGFLVNIDKVELRHASQRQMVTGLIVNDRLNVPRKFVRELRMLLHVWRKLGLDAAGAWYRKHDKKNRPPGKVDAPFRNIVRGKLQYLGYVRGWRDPVYVQLASKLARLDAAFKVTRKPDLRKATAKLKVFVEGETDKDHIDLALRALQARGHFRDLVLDIDRKGRGSGDLLKLCENLSQHRQSPTCVCIFDADETDIIKKLGHNGEDHRHWDNNVYSLILPAPAHREGEARWCIELLYKDSDLQRLDKNKRRLFLSAEFDSKTGLHAVLTAYHRYPSKSLVAEGGVFDYNTRADIALSKSGFATLIRSTDAPDFDGFTRLFQCLIALRNEAAGVP